MHTLPKYRWQWDFHISFSDRDPEEPREEKDLPWNSEEERVERFSFLLSCELWGAKTEAEREVICEMLADVPAAMKRLVTCSSGVEMYSNENKHTRVVSLAAYRKQRRLTQAQMAQVLGVSPSTIGNWEAGLRKTPKHVDEMVRGELA